MSENVNWTATPQQVERVIAAVLPHTESDGYHPVLTCVRIELVDGRFIAVATDRFTLAAAWADLSSWEEDAAGHEAAAACLYATDLRRLFAFLKPHKKSPVGWTLSDKGLTAAIGEESLTLRTVDLDFVNWRPILAKIAAREDGSTGTPVMRFTPRLINSFLQSAKALGEEFGQMHWHFGAGHLDAPLIRIGDNFIGLLMPQRLPDEVPQLDLSALGLPGETKAVAA